jgi:hypothetical protein
MPKIDSAVAMSDGFDGINAKRRALKAGPKPAGDQGAML